MHLFLLGALFFVLPFAVVATWGLFQLYLSGGILIWTLLSAVSLLLAKLCWSNVRRPSKGQVPEIEGEAFWKAEDEAVWQEVLLRAASVENGEHAIRSVEELEALGHELLQLVSEHYFPDSKKPAFEVNLSHLLLVCEQASRDLRVLAIENVPFHDRFSVNDFFKARDTLSLSTGVYSLYRGLRVVSNPVSAVFAELRELVTARAGKEIANTTSQWLLARFIESAGKHLINLYSGQAFDSQSVLRTNAKDAEDLLRGIPLRVVVTGQRDVGKTSFLDMLLPEESRSLSELGDTLLAYVGEHPNLGLIEVVELSLDTLLADAKTAEQKRARRYLDESELLCLLVAADNAARASDLALLEYLRDKELRSHLTPQALVLVSRCDLLPPRGWNPPYDWENVDANKDVRQREKVSSVQDCRTAIEEDLRLVAGESVILGAADSVETADLFRRTEALRPHFVRTKIQRALQAYRKEQRWSNVKSSVSKSGRMLAERTIDTAIHGAKGIFDFGSRRKR